MTAQIIDGNRIAEEILQEVRDKIQNSDDSLPKPCLAIVLCSDDPASLVYVARKKIACEKAGITSMVVEFGKQNCTQMQLVSTIDRLNCDCSVHGILIQLPLASGLDPHPLFDRIDPEKDVDVFSPTNIGLAEQGRPRFVSCTPQAVQEILIRSGIPIEGRRVAVINRSNVVGRPLFTLLSQNDPKANATVTMCHDYTPRETLQEVCLKSDIIVVAVGKPGFLTADLVPEGAVVVDVGINRDPTGRKIIGDVDFESVSRKAGWLTPVPGGVGPVVISCLLRNVIAAREFQQDN